MPTYREDNDPIPGEAELHIPELTSPEAAPRPSPEFRGLIGQDYDQPLAPTIRLFADMLGPEYRGWATVFRGWAERIEAEAAVGTALDVERLARALAAHLGRWHSYEQAAEAIAAEYERLRNG